MKQSLFKKADLGNYIGIGNVRANFKESPPHCTCVRSQIEGAGPSDVLGRSKNPYNMFATPDGAIEIAVQSHKSKAVALVKWLTKKGAEKIHE